MKLHKEKCSGVKSGDNDGHGIVIPRPSHTYTQKVLWDMSSGTFKKRYANIFAVN
jgi:hypothetical protein